MSKFISVPKNIEAMYNGEYGEWNKDIAYFPFISAAYLLEQDVD